MGEYGVPSGVKTKYQNGGEVSTEYLRQDLKQVWLELKYISLQNKLENGKQ